MTDQAGRIERVNGTDRAAAIDFGWGTIQWLVNGEQIPDSALTVGLVEIKPLTKNTRHYHPNCDEVLFLLDGELEHSVDDQRHHLQPGSAIHIPAGARHDARNLSRSVARMLVAYSSGDRQTVLCENGQE